MQLSEALDDFLLSCEADGLAKATVKWYRSIVTAFVEYYPALHLESVTTKQMRLYITALRSRDSRYVGATNKPEESGGLTVHSVASHVTALHRFWSWCADEYDMSNPMRGIKRHRPRKRIPKYVKPADFVKLFEACERSHLPCRDRAILAFLADTGCRVGGLVSLTVANLEANKGRALIQEKGGHWRRVEFTDFTARLLIQWLELREIESESVFNLKEGGVYQVLKRLKQRTGIRGHLSPHDFRHNFIQKYLMSGGDPFSLARLTGHRDMQTMMDYYAIFSDDDLADMHNKHTPLPDLLRG